MALVSRRMMDSGRQHYSHLVLWALVSVSYGEQQIIRLMRIEDVDPKRDAFSLEKLNKLGQITIRAYRAKAHQKQTPYIHDGTMPVARDSVPEKLMKGRLVKNNTKYANTEPHWILD